jgi:prepilin-type N-terminal cleavage/methylation domain-containing protein
MHASLNIRSADARHQTKFDQCGMSLLELMIAITVLSVGMLGATGMILAGVQSNSRNKTDTAAVVLDQQILEQFATLNNYPKTGTVTIADCGLLAGGANSHTASIIATTAGAGATVYTAATAPLPSQVGDIDWTQATPVLATSATPGYAMRYRTCNGDLYEVRWNVMLVNGVNSNLSLLTVSSRQLAAASTHATLLFSNPTTLRTLIDGAF